MQLLISTAILCIYKLYSEQSNPRQRWIHVLSHTCFQKSQNAQAPFESMAVHPNTIQNFKSPG